MKKLLIAAFAVAALASCKKEKIDAPAEPVFTKKMKSSASTYSNSIPESETFTYDAQSRISIYTSDDRAYTFDYNTAGKLFVIEKKNNVLQSTYDFDVNAKGLLAKLIQKMPNGSLSGTTNYEYNSDNYMISSETITANGDVSKRELEYLNGNVVKARTYKNGVLLSTYNYTHDLTKNYTLGWPAGFFPTPMFGKKVKNPVTSIKGFNASNTLVWNIEYTNNHNTEGYLIDISYLNKLTNATGTTTYLYE